MTVPTFTPTPVITPQTASDMPASIGSQIGATTDANFTKTKTWADQIEDELKIVRWTPSSAFITAATNFTIGGATFYMVRGKVVTLFVSLIRTSGTPALASAASGLINATTAATLNANYRPTYYPMGWGRTSLGPMVSYYIRPDGAIVIRGCSTPSYTFSTSSYSIEFEARWVNP